MPRVADEPLTKCTLNIYSTDIAEMKKVFGYGWSEQVRRYVREGMRRRRNRTIIDERLERAADE